MFARELVGLVLGVLTLISPCSSQAASTEPQQGSFLGKLTGSSESFAELRRTRRDLLAAIDNLEREGRSSDSEIQQLTRYLDNSTSLQASIEADLKVIESELNTRRTSGSRDGHSTVSGPIRSFAEHIKALPVAEIESRKSDLSARIEELKTRRQRLSTLEAQRGNIRDQLSKKQATLADVEERIGSLLNVSTNQYLYRAGVSFIFASIVFFLVLKFFRVVETDESVKMSIFSGDAGIQFITLFSIVIAVILFGILEILGANELSALLGGLSGYILGKTSPNRAKQRE